MKPCSLCYPRVVEGAQSSSKPQQSRADTEATTLATAPAGPGSPPHPSSASGQKRQRLLVAAPMSSPGGGPATAPMISQLTGVAEYSCPAQRSSPVQRSCLGPYCQQEAEGSLIPPPLPLLPDTTAASVPVQVASSPWLQHGPCHGGFSADGDGECIVHSLAPWPNDHSNAQASCQEPATQPQLVKELQVATQPQEAAYLGHSSLLDPSLLGSSQQLIALSSALPMPGSAASMTHASHLLPQKDLALQPAAGVETKAALQNLPSSAASASLPVPSAVAAQALSAAHAPPAVIAPVAVAAATGYQGSGWFMHSSTELRATSPRYDQLCKLLAADKARQCRPTQVEL